MFTATDAVKELLDLGVEPNAIEEELNFDSTSWPVLLGAYIGIAQSDNKSDNRRNPRNIEEGEMGKFGTQRIQECSGIETRLLCGPL